MQLEADRVRGSEAGRKWRTQCARWKERGRKPLSNVRSSDSAQRLRQNGWVWDVEEVEGARISPKCWGGGNIR